MVSSHGESALEKGTGLAEARECSGRALGGGPVRLLCDGEGDLQFRAGQKKRLPERGGPPPPQGSVEQEQPELEGGLSGTPEIGWPGLELAGPARRTGLGLPEPPAAMESRPAVVGARHCPLDRAFERRPDLECRMWPSSDWPWEDFSHGRRSWSPFLKFNGTWGPSSSANLLRRKSVLRPGRSGGFESWLDGSPGPAKKSSSGGRSVWGVPSAEDPPTPKSVENSLANRQGGEGSRRRIPPMSSGSGEGDRKRGRGRRRVSRQLSSGPERLTSES